MIGLLNIGSVVLGLIALGLPVVNLMRQTESTYNSWVTLSMLSLSACAISLFFQMFNSYNRVKAEDWSALMDIMGTRVSVSLILLVGAIGLNVWTLIVYRNRTIQ